MAVHPSGQRRTGTLVNALLGHFSRRPGPPPAEGAEQAPAFEAVPPLLPFVLIRLGVAWFSGGAMRCRGLQSRHPPPPNLSPRVSCHLPHVRVVAPRSPSGSGPGPADEPLWPPQFSHAFRRQWPGIVHRLDGGTSGARPVPSGPSGGPFQTLQTLFGSLQGPHRPRAAL